MPIDLAPLGDAHRLLLQVELQALQGSRFQPTGFPNLGPALYRGPGSDDLLLVESAQSMANRLEGVCWDEVADDWVKTLRGIPLVKVRDSAGRPMTNSVLDSHRLNSSYILDAQGQDGSNSPFVAIISERLSAIAPNGPVKIPELAKFVFCYCPNSLLHGVFFANRPHNERIGGGRLRLARVLSSFIEASGVRIAASGGVKIDRQDASGKTDGGSAETGYGNVPFPREEFTAESIIAYFNLDLAQLRGYGLGGAAVRFMVVFAFYKIRALMERGLRLRTACDLAPVGDGLIATAPAGYALPELAELEAEMPQLIEAVAAEGLFAEPRVTTVVYRKK